MTRIVIIGGGSFAWGPLFVRDILLTPELANSTIVLHDVDPLALELVFTLGKKLVNFREFQVHLEATTDLDEALAGAEYAILTITTGGLEAMRHDLEIPAKYGIIQSVGDTVGPGGLMRGLRNIPVVVEIAQRMEAVCPNAWLLNYTNPLTTLTRAVTRETSIKTIGLCHEYVGVLHRLARLFGVEPSEIRTAVAGINHLPWLLDIKVHGKDAMPRLHELAVEIIATRGKSLGNEESVWSTIDRGMVKSRLLQVFGALPVAGDRHVAEFFPFFLTEATEYGKQYGIELTDIEERYRWRARDENRLRSLLGEALVATPFLKETSHEAANKIIAALVNNGEYRGIMNLPNTGQIANLPSDAVVETCGAVDVTGARGTSNGELPPGIHAVVSRHVANQEMIVEAALSGDRGLALQALLNDPMVSLEPKRAADMLDEMLLANRTYLERFYP